MEADHRETALFKASQWFIRWRSVEAAGGGRSTGLSVQDHADWEQWHGANLMNYRAYRDVAQTWDRLGVLSDTVSACPKEGGSRRAQIVAALIGSILALAAALIFLHIL